MIRLKKSERDQIMGDTRTRLMQAAAEEFALKGYEGANVNTIASSAGFSIGTVYNYFPSKRDLMDAFIDEMSQLHVNIIKDSVLEGQNPAQRMANFFVSGFQFVEMHVTQAKAIFNAVNGPDAEFKQRLFQAYQPLFQLISQDILTPGFEQGVFQRVDPLSTSNLIMLLYLGVGSQLSPEGKLWLDPLQVSGFVLDALRVQGQPEKEKNDE